ncbi:MAG: hypothetical protein JXR77_12115, partial [Lentisphaeria bacterium]|nr:hypothetical protein [Lentisphaeria bacterium]
MSAKFILTFAVVFVVGLGAQEIGFVERYALAEDRSAVLQELVPGSEDAFAWTVLDQQNRGNLEESERLLSDYAKAYPDSARREVLLNRQRLLGYEADPERAVAHIRERLALRFDQQREKLPEEADFPTRLDPGLVAREALTQRALTQPGLRGFRTDRQEAVDLLLGLSLDPDRRRNLLNALDWPQDPNLADLVVADLKHQGSRGFGSLKAHGQLLLPQLDRCAEALPELLSNANFVAAYLGKLQPHPYCDWRNVPEEEDAYLARLWGFASRLPPSQNSLKAHVLYHRLQFDRGRGVFDRDLFTAYVQLPRPVPYIRREYLRQRNV